MVPLKIALAQTHIHFGSISDNLKNGLSLIDQASEEGCSLILFPELWTTGYDLENVTNHGLTNQNILSDLQKVCIHNKISVGGSYIFKHGDGFRNSFILIDSSGNIFPHYDKLHLIKLFDEDKYFTPGETIRISSFSWGKAGLSICYDLRFPELYRMMALKQVDIFLLVAEWPLKRIDHWNTLLKARAIENQVFLAAVNCAGRSGNETFGGSSSIISPWGEVLAASGTKEQALISLEIDLSTIPEYRKNISILEDRRTDVY